MSIEHWLNEDGRKAIEKMGWPEWESRSKETFHRLGIKDRPGHTGNPFVYRAGKKAGDRSVTWREFLALLRDHAREWLVEQGYFVSPATMADSIVDYVLYNFGCYERFLSTADHDAALIAAILAVEAQ